MKEASVKQITDNTEITHLKKILGLESGHVYDSTDKLRYGQIMIMTDQDHDGSHIKGLVMLILKLCGRFTQIRLCQIYKLPHCESNMEETSGLLL